MRQSQQAFTLIELMVVMAIMTIIFSLIGPLAQNQVDKVRASEEWYSLNRLMQEQMANAFFTGRRVFIKMEGNTLHYWDELGATNLVEFQYMMFPAQTVVFNTNGYPDINLINARLRGIPRQLELSPDSTKGYGKKP